MIRGSELLRKNTSFSGFPVIGRPAVWAAPIADKHSHINGVVAQKRLLLVFHRITQMGLSTHST